MTNKKTTAERQVARTTVLTTESEKKAFADHCRMRNSVSSNRIRDLMRIDIEVPVKLETKLKYELFCDSLGTTMESRLHDFMLADMETHAGK